MHENKFLEFTRYLLMYTVLDISLKVIKKVVNASRFVLLLLFLGKVINSCIEHLYVHLFERNSVATKTKVAQLIVWYV